MNKGLSEKNENNEKQFLDFSRSHPHSGTKFVHTHTLYTPFKTHMPTQYIYNYSISMYKRVKW